MKKIIELSLLSILGLVVLVVIALWQNHRMKFQQFLYPIELPLYRLLGGCDSSAPSWMPKVLSHSLGAQGGVSAQLSYRLGDDHVDCVIGVERPYRPIPANTGLSYRYASLTKLITASAVLRLESEGKLNLEDKLLSYFPEIVTPKDSRVLDIRLVDLLNHQAGFVRTSLAGDQLFSLNEKPWCPWRITQVTDMHLSFDVGSRVEYSNLGYCLLGEVVSRVSGKSYAHFIQENFKLTSYRINFIEAKFFDNEAGYDYRFDEISNASYLSQFDFEAIASSAGLMGSAKSFNRLLRDHYPPFPAAEKLRAAEQHCKDKSLTPCYYQGAQIYRESDDDFVILVHEGYLPGAASVAVLDSYGGITVLTKSGANRPQVDSRNHWKPFLYNQLKNYYAEEGLVAKTNHSRH